MLDRSSLFFVRVDKLEDRFEGRYSRAEYEHLRSICEAAGHLELFDELVEGLETVPARAYVNCWHKSPYESSAMWNLYSRKSDGVAIKTDFGALVESCDPEKGIHYGEIRYRRFDSLSEDEFTKVLPVTLKRKEFEYEQELRAFTIADRTPTDEEIAANEDYTMTGRYVQVDLSKLISEVVVAPYAEDWFYELVRNVVKMYDLAKDVNQSALASISEWELHS